jgi:adenine-specific DNA-methyltransferase
MIKDILDRNDDQQANDKQLSVLKEHFPACFKKDGSFDMERFKTEIADKTNTINEGYELRFLGKSYAKLLASTDTTTVIQPDEVHNSQSDNVVSENIYISGDNLDGLKHLLKSYQRKIKCIYIDPPYNTGSDGFVYQDNFNYTKENLQEKLSVSEDEAERILDLTRRGSASHSAWLMFMYCRLLLARDLLTEDGVIFVSIDDNEQSNLKLLCDDVFGEENFEGHIHWRRRHNQPNDKTKMIGLVAEHIISHSRNKEAYKKSGVGKVDLTGNFANPDNDPRGDWASKPWKVGSDQSGSRYKIINPISETVYDEEWMGDEGTFNQLVKDKRIVFPKKGDGFPRKKYFRFERQEEGQSATNWWNHEQFGHNQGANDEMTSLFGVKNVFSNPKPVDLLRGIIQISNAKNSDIVMDFFSGSGTTAHAVMQLNVEDGGNRRFIAIQLPEVLNSEKISQEVAFEFLKSNHLPATLDYVGMERTKRAAKKIKEDFPNKKVDLGFKHFMLAELNQNTLDKLESFDKASLIVDTNIIHDFGKATILTTWLNADGYGLTAQAENIELAGYTAYHYDKHLYLIDSGFNLDNMKALLNKYDSEGKFNPENLVLFGYSFPDWSINEMVEKNLRVLNDSEKNLKINLTVRY